MCRAGDRLRTENPPHGEAQRLAISGIEPERACFVLPIEEGNREKRDLDPPDGEKAKRRPSHIGPAILGQMAGLRDDS